MVLSNGQLPLYAAAGAAQQLFAATGGGGFEWNPEGVTFGIDFQTDRVFDGETVTEDYSTVLSEFEPASVSSRGMYINGEGANTHFPEATGALLDLLATNDYTVLIFWERKEGATSRVYLLSFRDDGAAPIAEIDYDTDDSHAGIGTGDWNNVGAPRSWSDNVISASLNDDGILASLNGATAVLSGPQITTAVERCTIGHRDGDNDIEGWIKAIIFYPASAVAATIEAYSANDAPINIVLPALSGFQEADGTLTASTGTWDGSPTSYAYRWFSDSIEIEGEASNSLDLAGGLAATVITALVQAINAEGRSGVVISNPIPASAEAPVISGTPEVGQELSCSTGDWSNVPTSYTYQWYDSSEAIAGATNADYTLVAGDVGEMMSCGVTAINAHGQALSFAGAVGPVT